MEVADGQFMQSSLGIPFVQYDTSLAAVEGGQFYGNDIFMFADQIIKYNPTTNEFDRITYKDGSGIWRDYPSGTPTTETLDADSGFLFSNSQASSRDVYVVGRASTTGRSIDIPDADVDNAYRDAGSGYPVAVAMEASGLTDSGFSGGITFIFSDQIIKYTFMTQEFDQMMWYRTTDESWQYYGSGSAFDFEPGECYLILNNNVSAPTEAYTWIYPKPYAEPPNN